MNTEFDTETTEMLPNGRKAPAPEIETIEAIQSGPLVKFNPLLEEIRDLKKESKGLKISGINDKTGYEAVRVAKGKAVSLRTTTEKIRKSMKEQILKDGKDIDNAAKKYEAMILEIEGPLSDMKNEIDTKIQAEKDARQAEINAKVKTRTDALAAVGVTDFNAIHAMSLASMDEKDFQAHLTVATKEFEEAETKRKADEAELARLRAEEEARKAREAQALEEQRKAQDARQAAQDAQEAELRAAREALDREKREAQEARDKEARDKAQAEAIAQAQEATRIATESRLKAESEAKAKAAQDAQERAEAEAKRLEALKPDQDKIRGYLDQISAMPLPEVSDPAIKKSLAEFRSQLNRLIDGFRP